MHMPNNRNVFGSREGKEMHMPNNRYISGSKEEKEKYIPKAMKTHRT